MRYEFIKIETIGNQEIAYLLDTEKGKVVRTLVENYSNDAVPTAAPAPNPVAPAQEKESLIPSVFKEEPKAEIPDRKLKPPPHLANVFGGNAQEKRTI